MNEINNDEFKTKKKNENINNLTEENTIISDNFDFPKENKIKNITIEEKKIKNEDKKILPKENEIKNENINYLTKEIKNVTGDEQLEKRKIFEEKENQEINVNSKTNETKKK